MADDAFTIAVFGACSSGKSSIINSVTRTNLCRISNDGKPMTLKPQLISSGNKIYIDTPGLPKSPSKISALKISVEQQPSMIWLVVNFAAAIENDEFDILNELPSVPVLVILNKVDFFKREDVENFNNENFFTKHRKLASVHKRLIEEGKTHRNISHILVTSIKDECDTERSPIGIDLLELITNRYIIQDQSGDAPSGL
jgi:GTPase Era involved in 16S rRNA processing